MEKELIILNGTCGSGKSTIANELDGYFVINGDDIIKEIKLIEGKAPKYNSDVVFSEYKKRMEQGFYQKKIVVINAVFDEDDIKRIMDDNNEIIYKHIILFPRIEVAIRRTEQRTCFKSITPRYWVEYFHKKMEQIIKHRDDIEVIDNSELTVEETKRAIIEIIDGNA